MEVEKRRNVIYSYSNQELYHFILNVFIHFFFCLAFSTQLNILTIFTTFYPRKKCIKKAGRRPKQVERYLCSQVGGLSIVKMTVLPKLIYRFSNIPVKIPAAFFVEIGKRILIFIWKCKRPVIVKLEKEQSQRSLSSQSCSQV